MNDSNPSRPRRFCGTHSRLRSRLRESRGWQYERRKFSFRFISELGKEKRSRRRREEEGGFIDGIRMREGGNRRVGGQKVGRPGAATADSERAEREMRLREGVYREKGHHMSSR
jgi:hypothetical protein